MTQIERAMQRARQRAKLPAGDHIVTTACCSCATPILCWNNDPILYPYYTHRVLCSYCRQAERAEKAMIFGRSP